MSLASLSGRWDTLTPEQKETLEKFKTELLAEGYYDPSLHDDHLLLRFLRARKFVLDASKKMWIDKEKWRKEYGTNDILKTIDFPEFPIVRQLYPRFYHKTDKFGRPIYIEKSGALDVKNLFSITTLERMLRYHVYEYEKVVQYRMQACSLYSGRHIEQSCTILDLNGVQISQFSSVFNVVREVTALAQNYYPEMLGKMFIINAPMLFTAIWTMVKPLLDEVTVNKIAIIGSNYKETLLQYIDSQNLPEAYGGTCTCQNGCENSDIGPWSDGSVEGFPKKEFELVCLFFYLDRSHVVV